MGALLVLIAQVLFYYVSWHVVMAAAPQLITVWWLAVVFAAFAIVVGAFEKYIKEHR